jgi:RimJ/RimL family protein N-acetyltransferase
MNMDQIQKPAPAIQVRPYRDTDFPVIAAWISDERFLIQWAGPGFNFPLPQTQFHEHLEKPGIHGFTALTGDGENIIGYAEINNLEAETGRLCRIIIGPPENRGMGYGSEFVRILVNLGRQAYHYRRITLAVFDFNTSAATCYQSLGFEITHVRENAVVVGHESWTALEMTLEV